MHRPGKVNLAADALSRTEMPQDEQDKENPDKYLVYSEIDDVYQITKDKSINQSGKSKELCVLNIEPHSKFSVNQIIKKDWKLETKKDYPLQLVIDIVKDGKLPNQDDRKQLPPITNLYLNWFNFLYVKDELLNSYAYYTTTYSGSQNTVELIADLIQTKMAFLVEK